MPAMIVPPVPICVAVESRNMNREMFSPADVTNVPIEAKVDGFWEETVAGEPHDCALRRL